MAQTTRRNTFLSTNRSGGTVAARTGTKRRSQFLMDKDVSTFEKDSLTKDQLNTGGLSRIQSLYLAGGILDTAAIAVGAISKASAIRAKGKFEEAAFIENARRFKIAAEDAKKRGHKDATTFMRRVRGLVGSQRAALGASGISIDKGSSADIQAETIEIGSEGASTIRTNAYREAFGYELQAIEQESAARMSRSARKNQTSALKRKAILQTTSSVVSTGASMNKAGSA